MRRPWQFLVFSAVCFTSFQYSGAAEEKIFFKQVAAPPENFPRLRLPDPSQLGVRSHSAMLPVFLEEGAQGKWIWEENLPVEAALESSFLIFSGPQRDWQFELETSQGERIRFAEPGQSPFTLLRRAASVGFGRQRFSGDLLTVADLPAGVIKFRIEAPQSWRQGSARPDGYLVYSTPSSIQIYSYLDRHDLLRGNLIGISTYAFDTNENEIEGKPLPFAGLIQKAFIRSVSSDGSERKIPMHDDGQHGDELAGDGVFGAWIPADRAGESKAQVFVEGIDPAGKPFLRSSEHVFPVMERKIQSLADSAAGFFEKNQIQIQIAGKGDLGEVKKVQLAAEVWGKDDLGTEVPVVWIGSMVIPQQRKESGDFLLSIPMDSRWIGHSQARHSFELRNVRVQDVGTQIVMAQQAQVSLALPSLPASAFAFVAKVAPGMLTGLKPAKSFLGQIGPFFSMPLVPPKISTLLLVHGYCSEGVWPETDFTQSMVFQDFHQNRSHDEFAQLILQQGAGFDSYGIVAHSQGGAASLHLYTYYWSGLDDAQGPRLIQSVGTPYQGTALAGNLALLGEIFGAGCGINFDLTYNGAALWLANIPSWARGEVFYHTTSFEDEPFSYDYCHVATDLFLTDPDDGTTERWAGQLPGANNMGHTEGWCHSNGMAEPAQFTDHARNALMNQMAAR